MREVTLPFGPAFLVIWNLWKDYKKEEHKFRFKSTITEQMCLKKLVKLSAGKEEIAIQIIEESIANGWSGLFKLKENGKQNINSGSMASAFAKIDSMPD